METADPEYVEGLRATIPVALDYGFAGIEHSEGRSPPVPAALLVQARLAARNGISLDTVLRRYFAGYTLLGDFLVQEAEGNDRLGGGALNRLLRAQAALFDRLITVVTEEYTREADSRLDTAEQRRAARIERLLDGELLDTSSLAYDFDVHHLGIIATGLGATEAVRGLAKTLDRRLLLIHRGEGAIWAWLGTRHEIDFVEAGRIISSNWSSQTSLAIGEPAEGLSGWRLTHRQAKAALPIALRSPEAFTRYADVVLLASMLQDDLLCSSLPELYLKPLGNEPGAGGETLKQTLRAYLATGRNVSSTASALGVSRQTVASRLRTSEKLLGRTITSCATEIDAALRLDDLSVQTVKQH